MTVKELIKKLEQYNPDLDVWVTDEIEGNDCPMTGISVYQKQYCRISGKPLGDALFIRWCNDSESHNKYYIHHYSESKQQEIRDCGYLIKEDGLICWSKEQIDRMEKEAEKMAEWWIDDSRYDPESYG